MVVLIENMNKKLNVVLKPADLEAIEQSLYRHGDDIAMAVSRAFERLEEKMDAMESRIYAHLTQIKKELKTALTNQPLCAEDNREVFIGK